MPGYEGGYDGISARGTMVLVPEYEGKIRGYADILVPGYEGISAGIRGY